MTGKKFKVNATIVTTMTISKEVSAASMQEATIVLLKESQKSDWKIKSELKTNTK